MPDGISRQQGPAIQRPTGNSTGEAAASLDGLDFGNPRAVKVARETMMKMAAWDSIPDWVFQAGVRPLALTLIRDKFLCEQAAIWQEQNPDKLLAEGLGERARLTAQNTFLTLLSPRGALAMMESREAFLSGLPGEEEDLEAKPYPAVPGGLRYVPDIGDPVANDLMGVVMTYRDAVDTLRAMEKYDAAALLRCTVRGQDAPNERIAEAVRKDGPGGAVKSPELDEALLEYIAMSPWNRTDTPASA